MDANPIFKLTLLYLLFTFLKATSFYMQPVSFKPLFFLLLCLFLNSNEGDERSIIGMLQLSKICIIIRIGNE